MIAVLHLGFFSYWINTYTGSFDAALGGAWCWALCRA